MTTELGVVAKHAEATEALEPHYLTEATEAAIKNAIETGQTVVYRTPASLLVDLDGMSIREFELRLKAFRRLRGFKIPAWRYWESKTAGHYHVEVDLGYDGAAPTAHEVIAMQLALGSDFQRELSALNDLTVGNPNWSILFRPPDAVVVERTKESL